MVMEAITITYQDDVVGAVSFDTERDLGHLNMIQASLKKISSCPRSKCHYRIVFIAFPNWISIPLNSTSLKSFSDEKNKNSYNWAGIFAAILRKLITLFTPMR